MIKRVVLAFALPSLVLAAFPVGAQAAAGPPVGHVSAAVDNTFTHRLHVAGWAYDPAAPATSITVRVVVDATYAVNVRADLPSAQLDSDRHLTGAHRFAVTVPQPTTAKSVVLKSRGIHTTAPLTVLGSRTVTPYYPPAGTRIITVAKQHVGDPYAAGGASPAGFDCSGFTLYVYEHARVRTLPHSAESQRERTRPISRSSARPGDLVFYMSGGTAYHVAIYAGHGWQYAAADARYGVRYQRVWSSAVQYRTDWH